MTPAERVRRHRAKRARDAAALRLNQIVCGHAAEVMAGWPSKSIDLIITSPPYWDAVIYDGEMPPWPSYHGLPRRHADRVGGVRSGASTKW